VRHEASEVEAVAANQSHPAEDETLKNLRVEPIEQSLGIMHKQVEVRGTAGIPPNVIDENIRERHPRESVNAVSQRTSAETTKSSSLASLLKRRIR
jgi:hypothetical protein